VVGANGDFIFGILLTQGETKMSDKLKPTHEQPGGFVKENDAGDDGVFNDSLGTVDPADSTGDDEEKETGDAKAHNKDTRED
jgi:hypothetical protein